MRFRKKIKTQTLSTTTKGKITWGSSAAQKYRDPPVWSGIVRVVVLRDARSHNEWGEWKVKIQRWQVCVISTPVMGLRCVSWSWRGRGRSVVQRWCDSFSNEPNNSILFWLTSQTKSMSHPHVVWWKETHFQKALNSLNFFKVFSKATILMFYLKNDMGETNKPNKRKGPILDNSDRTSICSRCMLWHVSGIFHFPLTTPSLLWIMTYSLTF